MQISTLCVAFSVAFDTGHEDGRIGSTLLLEGKVKCFDGFTGTIADNLCLGQFQNPVCKPRLTRANSVHLNRLELHESCTLACKLKSHFTTANKACKIRLAAHVRYILRTKLKLQAKLCDLRGNGSIPSYRLLLKQCESTVLLYPCKRSLQQSTSSTYAVKSELSQPLVRLKSLVVARSLHIGRGRCQVGNSGRRGKADHCRTRRQHNPNRCLQPTPSACIRNKG